MAPRKAPGADKPVCLPGAICFSGEVYAGKEFRKALSNELEFVLEPGWIIAIVPKRPQGHCQEFASVVNIGYRAHKDLYIVSYEWTAEQEVSASPRQFNFVTNCADYRTESERLEIVLWGNKVTHDRFVRLGFYTFSNDPDLLRHKGSDLLYAVAALPASEHFRAGSGTHPVLRPSMMNL